MEDEQLEDLKRFIDSRISQSGQSINDRLDNINDRLDQFEIEMKDGFAGVGEVIEEINNSIDVIKRDKSAKI
jgi:archaellum component FlaC